MSSNNHEPYPHIGDNDSWSGPPATAAALKITGLRWDGEADHEPREGQAWMGIRDMRMPGFCWLPNDGPRRCFDVIREPAPHSRIKVQVEALIEWHEKSKTSSDAEKVLLHVDTILALRHMLAALEVVNAAEQTRASYAKSDETSYDCGHPAVDNLFHEFDRALAEYAKEFRA